jgi:hypothetical protein
LVTRFRFEASFSRGIVASSLAEKIAFDPPARFLRCDRMSRKHQNITNVLLYIQFSFRLMNDIGVSF